MMLSKVLISTNHKIISILYFLIGLMFGFVGFFMSWLFRLELSNPGSFFFNEIFYYNLITAHGLIMIFFMLMPILISSMGNWLIPYYHNINDLYFPRMNNMSFWFLFFSGILLILAAVSGSGPYAGWTIYVPLSNIPFSSDSCMDLTIFSLHLAGASSMAGSINFISSMLQKGLNWNYYFIMSVFMIAYMSTFFLLLLSLPVLASVITMLLFDRNLNSCFFQSDMGGDMLLFQHLFWFFGHPEVYILILPVFGIVSYITTLNTSKYTMVGNLGMMMCILSILILGCGVWGHHMFTLGMDYMTNTYFSLATLLIAVPTGVKIFTWGMNLWTLPQNSDISTYWVYGFMALFCVGGFSGVMLGNTQLDIFFHDSMFVVAHFHYVLSMGAVFGIFLMLTYWLPVFFGISMKLKLLKIHFFLTYLNVNLIFLTMHLAGMSGMPRRVSDYPDIMAKYNFISTLGMTLSTLSLFLFIFINVGAALNLSKHFTISLDCMEPEIMSAENNPFNTEMNAVML